LGKIIRFYKPPSLTQSELNELNKRITRILKSGRLSKGPYVMELESRFKENLGVEYAHACSSCSIGLLIALRAVKLRRRYGSNIVALPAFTWPSTLFAVTANGYTPLFLDINPETWNITEVPYVADAVVPVHVFGNICEVDARADAVVPVHVFGNICEVDARVPVIYDAAHAFGAKIKDFGDVSVFSLAPTKSVTAGEGGIIVTNDLELSKRIVELRDKISRLSEVHAAIALTYLEKFPTVLERKKEIFEYYRRKIPAKFQKIDRSHSYSVFGMLCNDPESVLKRLEGKVEVRRYYDPLAPLPVTTQIRRKIVCLPCYPEVDEKKIVRWILK